MEGTSKTPHSQAEAYILSQQSSVRIVFTQSKLEKDVFSI